MMVFETAIGGKKMKIQPISLVFAFILVWGVLSTNCVSSGSGSVNLLSNPEKLEGNWIYTITDDRGGTAETILTFQPDGKGTLTKNFRKFHIFKDKADTFTFQEQMNWSITSSDLIEIQTTITDNPYVRYALPYQEAGVLSPPIDPTVKITFKYGSGILGDSLESLTEGHFYIGTGMKFSKK